jgi:hypothetical protein
MGLMKLGHLVKKAEDPSSQYTLRLMPPCCKSKTRQLSEFKKKSTTANPGQHLLCLLLRQQ